MGWKKGLKPPARAIKVPRNWWLENALDIKRQFFTHTFSPDPKHLSWKILGWYGKGKLLYTNMPTLKKSQTYMVYLVNLYQPMDLCKFCCCFVPGTDFFGQVSRRPTQSLPEIAGFLVPSLTNGYHPRMTIQGSQLLSHSYCHIQQVGTPKTIVTNGVISYSLQGTKIYIPPFTGKPENKNKLKSAGW